MTPPRVPEKAEQAHSVQLVRSIGGTSYVLGTKRRRDDFQGTMQSPGVPDVIHFIPDHGRTVLLFHEVKAADGRLRPEQRAFQEGCIAAGVAHIVGGLDTLIGWLTARGIVQASNFPHYRQLKESSR